jgi:dinuclear metal center YbgI/SA1388 family protein
MPTTDEVLAWLDARFRFVDWRELDGHASGLQVARRGERVERIAVAVDARQASIDAAAAAGAQMLIVHHGLLWGRERPVTGALHRRLAALIAADIALVGIHLPLDAHPELGNNIGLMRALGAVEIAPFGLYKGRLIGMKGRLPEPLPLAEVAQRICAPHRPLAVCDHRRAPVRTVAAVSGGAPRESAQAIAHGLDCYITGDASHEAAVEAAEHGLDLIFGGHYATETAGVRQTAAALERELGVATVFIDLPTGV